MSDKAEVGEVTVLDDDFVAPFPDEKDTKMTPVQQEGRLVEVENPFRGLAETNQGASMTGAAMAEVRFQMEMARAFPRDRDTIHTSVAHACKDPAFASVALWSFPRGKKADGSVNYITGPSIKLAEELGRHWGNLNWGSAVIADNESHRTVRCFAHDLETNSRKSQDITFEKSIQRWENGQLVWVPPNERDLLELTNRQSSKGIRNVLLSQIPDALKRNAMSWCKQTMAKKDAEDPDRWRHELLLWFANRGIKPRDLTNLMGQPLEQVHAKEDVEYLRGVATRIRDGDANWTDVLAERAETLGLEGPPPRDADELRRRISERAAMQSSSAPRPKPNRKEN